MSNELEKQFFQSFGFEPKTNREYGYTMAIYNEVGEEIKFYPQITDRILLGMICICSQYGFCPTARNIKDLKLKVLERFLELKKNLKNNYEHQGCHSTFVRKVRTLFKDE